VNFNQFSVYRVRHYRITVVAIDRELAPHIIDQHGRVAAVAFVFVPILLSENVQVVDIITRLAHIILL